MRTQPIVRLVYSQRAGATFNALHNVVTVSTKLASILTRHELEAVLLHEYGHRQLYHVEREWIVITLLVGLVVTFIAYGEWVSALVALVVGSALITLLEFSSQFEADYFAMRHSSPAILLRALLKIAEHEPEFAVGAELQMRIRFARWCSR